MPLITYEGLHQLHILIFLVAVSHVLHCACIMLVSYFRVRSLYLPISPATFNKAPILINQSRNQVTVFSHVTL